MGVADILHKFIVLEVIFIIVKAVILIWLFFKEINPLVLAVVAIGSGFLLKLIYTILRRKLEQRQ